MSRSPAKSPRQTALDEFTTDIETYNKIGLIRIVWTTFKSISRMFYTASNEASYQLHKSLKEE